MNNPKVSPKTLKVNYILNNVMLLLCTIAMSICLYKLFTEPKMSVEFSIIFLFFGLVACFFMSALNDKSLKA